MKTSHDLFYVNAAQLMNHMESRWVSERLTESLQDVGSQRENYGVPELQKGLHDEAVSFSPNQSITSCKSMSSYKFKNQQFKKETK